MVQTVLLTVLDGWGYSTHQNGNSLLEANLPVYNHLLNTCPHTIIYAHGEEVGLPEGQMGNSEVGHMNLGAGRVVYQDLSRINLAIQDGSFFSNPVLEEVYHHVTKHHSKVHLLGLTSDGGVHSTLDHLYALVEFFNRKDFKDVYLHAFLDGRDTAPNSAVKYLAEVEKFLQQHQFPPVATVIGRYYAMDRDKRWDRVEKAYNALLLGEAQSAENSVTAVETSYAGGVQDEFVLPVAINPEIRIKDDDAVIFFNFRADRARQITQALIAKDFDGFMRKKVLTNLKFVSLTEYDQTFKTPVLFPSGELKNILGEVLEKQGLSQFRTAETEKYAHVTFFFNGGREEPFKNEDRALVPSPKVATYDLQPEMSAYEVTEKVVAAVQSGKYSFILVNYANPDMVGHTGARPAAIKAVETIDQCLGKIVESLKGKDITMLLTADHGNVECMIDEETGEPHTAHTTNLVPLILINNPHYILKEGKYTLADIAPTVLSLLEIDIPSEMTGKSFISQVGIPA